MITLSGHKKGDTYLGLGPITVQINSIPLNLSGASIRMQIRKQKEWASYAHEWNTESGTISILNPLSGEFFVESGIIDVPAHNYYFDIEITTNDGRVITPIEGTWEILSDVTR